MWVFLGALLGLLVVLVLCLQLSLHAIEGRIQTALGPKAMIGSIHVGLGHIEIDELSWPAPPGWPGKTRFRVHKATVVPRWRSLWSSGKIGIKRIVLDGAVLTGLRRPRGTMLVIPELPVLSGTAETPGGGTPDALTIGLIEAKDLRIELYDESVRNPPVELVADPVRAELRDIELPLKTGRVSLAAEGSVVSPTGQGPVGSFEIAGWIAPSSGDSDITLHLKAVPLVELQPYLIKATETGVAGGTLDLDLKARVQNRRLYAPGVLDLDHLELASSGGTLQTFMGLSRKAVLDSLAGKNGRIELHFTLEGNLDDPHFSVNEDLALRAGAGLAQALGVSVGAVAQAVGAAGETGVDTAGKMVQGAGSAVAHLFGH